MPRKPEESWFERVANRMVQEGKSFPQACSEENVFLQTAEADKHFKRASFQKVLRQARHRFHNEIARDPERNKTTLIGQLQVCADKLMGEGSFDKAAEVLLKISKIEGWAGPDNVQVFGNLTQAQIDQARDAIQKKLLAQSSDRPAPTGTEQPLPN
jgi:hypothetical protein